MKERFLVIQLANSMRRRDGKDEKRAQQQKSIQIRPELCVQCGILTGEDSPSRFCTTAAVAAREMKLDFIEKRF